ncbi:MAG: DUF1684 domain-containing protein [Saprospiraceae bacterium]
MVVKKAVSIAVCVFLFLGSQRLSAQTAHPDIFSETARHRTEYKQDFLTNPRSPLRAADTALLDFFPPDPAWRIVARFEHTPDAQPFDMLTYSGRTKPFRRYGFAHFEIAGTPYRLALYTNLTLAQQEAYRDHLFLPFKDHTNGEATYGGGRYLDLTIGDIAADGSVVLDLNKVYNPWCAYSDGFNCPIPPAENHLELPVPAGERNFKGDRKH